MYKSAHCLKFILLTLFFSFPFGQSDLKHVQSFQGEVGAENFTYYKLVLEGHVVVNLHTLEGDADLYLSTETLKPTWMDYTTKSDTCSHETVVVYRDDVRPVGIGVYGYVHHPVSKYVLSVYVDNLKDDYYPNDILDKNPEPTPHKLSDNVGERATLHSSDNDEESIFWSILIGLLKFILEILI